MRRDGVMGGGERRLLMREERYERAGAPERVGFGLNW